MNEQCTRAQLLMTVHFLTACLSAFRFRAMSAGARARALPSLPSGLTFENDSSNCRVKQGAARSLPLPRRLLTALQSVVRTPEVEARRVLQNRHFYLAGNPPWGSQSMYHPLPAAARCPPDCDCLPACLLARLSAPLFFFQDPRSERAPLTHAHARNRPTDRPSASVAASMT